MKKIGGKFKISWRDFIRRNPRQFQDFLVSDRKYFLTFSGKDSLRLIIKTLELNQKDEILLPSYLCKEILKPFKENNIKICFYKINKNFQTDLEDIKKKININTKVLLVIHYFGFLQNEINKIRETCRSKNIFLIEDIVQSFLTREDDGFTGASADFSFNSYIKFLPINGSLLSVKENLSVIPVLAEMTMISKLILKKINFQKIIKKRRENFQYLLNELKNTDYPFFKELPDNVCPLGFPILSEKRDLLKKHLISNKIYPPVHWELLQDIDKNEFSVSWEISRSILTLPIDQRYGLKEMDYIVKTIKKFNV